MADTKYPHCCACGKSATHKAVTCGHYLCESCKTTVWECPQCRERITSAQPISSSPFIKDYSNLLGDPNTDVEIIVNEVEKYKCHSVVLQSSCPTLYDMLSYRGRTEVMVANPIAFPDFMRYLYTRFVPSQLSVAKLVSLIKIAHQFRVEWLYSVLEDKVETYLNRTTPSPDSIRLVFELFCHLHSFRNAAAVEAALRVAASNAAYLLRQPFILTCPANILVRVLKHPSLRVATRRQLELFLKEWMTCNYYHPDINALANNPDYLASVRTDPTGLSASVVCFYADGTPQYTDMTLFAIKTLLEHTPQVCVGVLIPYNDEEIRKKVQGIIDPNQSYRVFIRNASQEPHIPNWNPTQFKLDIAQFAEETLGFENIFWVDSDTITMDDMTPFFLRFTSQSEKLFYMTEDHAMFDPEFVKRWKEHWELHLIPQACLMGFKSSVIAQFFAEWKAYWYKWVVPEPFAQMPDPRPHFSGSAFCTEQYALGQALNLNNWYLLVMLFPRRMVEIQVKSPSAQSTTSTTPTTSTVLTTIDMTSLATSLGNLSLSTPIRVSDDSVLVDMFGGAIIHAYHHQYQRVREWWDSRTT